MDNNNVIHQARYVLKSNWIQAVKILKEALEKDATNIDIYEELADIFVEMKNYDQALEYLQKAIAIDPSKVGIRFKLANMYLELDQPIDAIEHYDKLDDVFPETYFNKALAYYLIHQIDDAIDCLKELLRITNKIERAYFFLIELLLLYNRFDECEKYILETKRQFGDSPQLSYMLANNYFKQFKPLQAYNEFLKALPGHKDETKIYQLLGETAANIGQIEMAITHLKDGIRECRNKKPLILDLIQLKKKNNQLNNTADLRKLVSEFDDNTAKMILNYYYSLRKKD
ncbi:MAG: tetratricopeptide repeat protein [Candidatus Cloacimonetes bacterium]|nr:tetratricopeptide repeat protein [Candidatus Cloacimonadota bacterium]